MGILAKRQLQLRQLIHTCKEKIPDAFVHLDFFLQIENYNYFFKRDTCILQNEKAPIIKSE